MENDIPIDWFMVPNPTDDFLDWFLIRDGTVPSPRPSENLHHLTGFPLLENHSYNPHHHPNLNPSFKENLYDYLEHDFSRLSLSTSRHQSRGSHLGNNSMIGSSNMDLQRMRVESAVRGNMGMYMQPPLGLQSSYGMNRNGSDNIRSTYEDINMGMYMQPPLGLQSSYGMNRNWSDNIRSTYEDINMGMYMQPPLGLEMSSYGTNRNGPDNIRSRSESSRSVSRPCLNNNNLWRLRNGTDLGCLEELRGRVFLAAKEQQGCRFLQDKLEERKAEEIELVFSEVKDHVRELMVDQFGNYVIQKLVEVCNYEQINQILIAVVNDDRSLVAICLDMHGTRAMQKLLEHLTTQEQRSLVVSVLRRITVTLTKSMNGHHVIQHCLKFFSSEDMKHILNVVADNCLDIATDKSGCCVLQQCVAHARGEPKQRLVEEVIANALILSENAYGNYVVQYIIGMRVPRVASDILSQLAGSFVSLSMNKYGSNVVEKFLKESGEDQSYRVIEELIRSPKLLMLTQHPYGNYVVQSAYDRSKGNLKEKLVQIVNGHYSFLHSHPHGKRVLARCRGSKHVK